jgi:hypothetical protein
MELTAVSMQQVTSGWNKDKSPSARTASWDNGGASPRSKTIRNSITSSSSSLISYDITKTNHIFTAPSYRDAPKPTDNVLIGISHTHVPTCWCPKCDRWESHPESIHRDRMAFLRMIRARTENNDQKYGQSNNNTEGYQRSTDQ